MPKFLLLLAFFIVSYVHGEFNCGSDTIKRVAAAREAKEASDKLALWCEELNNVYETYSKSLVRDIRCNPMFDYLQQEGIVANSLDVLAREMKRTMNYGHKYHVIDMHNVEIETDDTIESKEEYLYVFFETIVGKSVRHITKKTLREAEVAPVYNTHMRVTNSYEYSVNFK